MNEKLRKALVYSLFGASIIWGVCNIFDNKKETATELPQTIQPDSSEALPLTGRTVINVEARRGDRWGSDPFQAWRRKRTGTADTDENQQSAGWVLTGIMYIPDNPLAYINWKSVRVGDMVDGARVISIDRKAVTLEQNGSRFTISISKG